MQQADLKSEGSVAGSWPTVTSPRGLPAPVECREALLIQ